MPIPQPTKEEKENSDRDGFMSRCIATLANMGEFESNRIRAGVCATQWERAKEGKSNTQKAWGVAEVGYVGFNVAELRLDDGRLMVMKRTREGVKIEESDGVPLAVKKGRGRIPKSLRRRIPNNLRQGPSIVKLQEHPEVFTKALSCLDCTNHDNGWCTLLGKRIGEQPPCGFNDFQHKDVLTH